MSPAVAARAIGGVWVRHVPHGARLLGRATTPADGRWQHGEMIAALYLADSAQRATAEWYRSLAERGFAAQDYLPYDHHRRRIELGLADLSDADRLATVGSTRRGRAGARGQHFNVSANGSGARAGRDSSLQAPHGQTRSS